LTYALKTWTSNMKSEKWNLPRDGLVAAYTPDNLILMWAGNTDASPMFTNAFWWTIHAQPLKDFLWWLLKWWYITNKEMTNVETSTLSISKITWKLPSDTTPWELITSTIWYVNNLPKESDGGVTMYEYDVACGKLVSPLTPAEEVKKWYYMKLTSFMPNNDDLESIKGWWEARAKIPAGWEWWWGFSILTEIPEWYCENREPSVSDEINVSIIDPETNQRISAKPSIMYSIKSSAALKTLTINVDWTVVYSKNYKRQYEDIATADIDLSNFEPWTHTITVQAMDVMWKMNSASISDVLEADDKEPPYLVVEQSKKQDNGDWTLKITLVFDDHLSWIPWGSVSSNWTLITTFYGRLVTFTTSAEVFDVEVKDSYWNVLNKSIDIADL
jgi:hypothetical protein